MSELKNPFGLVNNRLTHIKDIEKGIEVFCSVCGELLIVRQGEKTIKHLSHRSQNDSCNSESVIHKLSKQYLYNELKTITIQSHKIEVENNNFKLADPQDLQIKSKYIEYRKISDNYIPDIFLILEGGYKIALEICYKNPKNINHLEEILPGLPIDMVLEIKVTEDDVEKFDIKDLMDRGNIIYNKNSEKFYMACEKIQKTIDRFIKEKDHHIKYLKKTILKIQEEKQQLDRELQKTFDIESEQINFINMI